MVSFLMVIEDVVVRSKLELIYHAYHRVMYFTAFNILNNTHDAQDVVQTSILKLAKFLDKVDEVNCNKTKYFIVTIVRNSAIDLYRQKQRKGSVQFEDVQDELIDDVMPVDELVIRMGDAETLAIQLAELDISYADVLTFKYYYEMNDAEIAELIGISPGNVRTRLHRARLALRLLMEKDVRE